MGAIISALAGWLLSMLRVGLSLGAWKAFFGVLLMAILGVVLYNLAVDLVQELLQFVVNTIGSHTGDVGVQVVQLTGLAAWFADQLKLPQCMAVIVSFTMLGWVLRKIPFIRW